MIQNQNEYAPVTRDVLRVIQILGLMTPEDLTYMFCTSIFTNPEVIHDQVRVWLRTIQRRELPVSCGRLLYFLTTAPINPCVQHRIVGGGERALTLFLPFGNQSPLAAALIIPLNDSDVRFIRAIQLLSNNHFAFPVSKQDPVSGCWTFSGFTYRKRAQTVLDNNRPLFVASAMRAIGIELRISVARYGRSKIVDENASIVDSGVVGTKAGVLPRIRLEQMLLRHPMSYERALEESVHISQIGRELHEATATGSEVVNNGNARAKQINNVARDLLNETFRFVFRERMVPSSCQYSRHIKHCYSVFPTVEELYEFGRQTTTEWIKRIKSIIPTVHV